MASRLLKFFKIAHEPPHVRDAGERICDFDEISDEFIREKAAEQASRCSQCGIPFCQSHCPLGNHIPDWLQLAAEGRVREAYEVSAATNPMPEVCGRVCPQDRLCEGNCVVEKAGFGTVTIGAVERWLTDTAVKEGWIAPIAPEIERGESVAIVGAGPAGMAAAERLRRAGFQVTVLDRYDRAGGLMIYGIPNFKLDKSIPARRHEALREGGVRFALGWELGRDGTIADLRRSHDAVILAFGAYAARRLDLPGEAGMEPVAALDFLTASNRKGLGDAVPGFEAGELNAHAKKVVVVGGGDTAMDCVRTAVRQGAASVTCLYRRGRDTMPGSAREVKHAEAEGVTFQWLSAPARIGEGHIEVQPMKLDMSAGGRGTVLPDEGPVWRLEADMVIEALGFSPEDAAAMAGGARIELTRRGTVKADPKTFETGEPGVYAAGDLVRGPSLVVWALKDAITVSDAIVRRFANAREPA
ncbi:NAD(P)-dependent oxidoreductase [Marinicauda algicola]|uniref:NAD(P)-dependent oxidoreductase n=1 Tax=Marinicauda algicola TaxID=2029849 RepID=A0A4S2GWY5_9PROT|nr:NAD(P)-dependent oxidoreductase [Marinicauda algicola]TGY87660.1 NAD(P)-dependent oxidoreductase [Marinicauda algicola]